VYIELYISTHTSARARTHTHNVYMYIHTESTDKQIANTDKDCDLLQDRPVLSSERTPHDVQNRNCPYSSKNLVMSPRGGSKPGLTD